MVFDIKKKARKQKLRLQQVELLIEDVYECEDIENNKENETNMKTQLQQEEEKKIEEEEEETEEDKKRIEDNTKRNNEARASVTAILSTLARKEEEKSAKKEEESATINEGIVKGYESLQKEKTEEKKVIMMYDNKTSGSLRVTAVPQLDDIVVHTVPNVKVNENSKMVSVLMLGEDKFSRVYGASRERSDAPLVQGSHEPEEIKVIRVVTVEQYRRNFSILIDAEVIDFQFTNVIHLETNMPLDILYPHASDRWTPKNKYIMQKPITTSMYISWSDNREPYKTYKVYMTDDNSMNYVCILLFNKMVFDFGVMPSFIL